MKPLYKNINGVRVPMDPAEQKQFEEMQEAARQAKADAAAELDRRKNRVAQVRPGLESALGMTLEEFREVLSDLDLG